MRTIESEMELMAVGLARSRLAADQIDRAVSRPPRRTSSRPSIPVESRVVTGCSSASAVIVRLVREQESAHLAADCQ